MALDFRPFRVIKHEEARLRAARSVCERQPEQQRLKTPKRVGGSVQPERTPFVIKSYANNIATDFDPDAGNVVAEKVRKALANHLKGATHYDMDNLYDDVVHNSPPIDVPTILNIISDPISNTTLVKYDLESHKWVDWPDTNKIGTEAELCDYLNNIADSVRGILGLPCKGNDLVFSAEYKSTGPKTGHSTVRKPDLIAIPRKLKDEKLASWFDFRSFGSLKIGTQGRKVESEQIMEFARCCFIGRPNRNYVVGFGFLHNKLSFYVFDRSGVLATPHYDVNEHPEVLLQFAVSILFMNETQLGYDTSLSLLGTDPSVKAGEKSYNILHSLHVDRTLRGRGTVCFMVQNEDGKVFVTKDSWVDRTKSTTEVEVLKALKDSKVQNVPTLISSEIVPIDASRKGSTEIFRTTNMVKELNCKNRAENLTMFRNSEIRDHYRIVQEPYGEPLDSFRTLEELLSGTLDILVAIDALDKIGIIHRDVSINNIILVYHPSSDYRKGYLIDFDNAVKKDDTREAAIAKRTGTLEFMAFLILRKAVPHSAIHDAESLLYVLIWIAVKQQGPNFAKRSNFNAKDTILGEWAPTEGINEKQLLLVSRSKELVMRDEITFEDNVISAMHPFFAPLQECFLSMRQALFPPPPRRVVRKLRVKSGEPSSSKSGAAEPERQPSEILGELKEVVHSCLKNLQQEGEKAEELVAEEPRAPAESLETQASSGDEDIFTASRPIAPQKVYHSRYRRGLKLPQDVEYLTEADEEAQSQEIPSPGSPTPVSAPARGFPAVPLGAAAAASSSVQSLGKRSRDWLGPGPVELSRSTKKPKTWDEQRENIAAGHNDRSQFSSTL